MSNEAETNPSRVSYENFATSREACESIIESNPHHIRYLPLRFIDSRLAALALKLGAKPEEVPALPA